MGVNVGDNQKKMKWATFVSLGSIACLMCGVSFGGVFNQSLQNETVQLLGNGSFGYTKGSEVATPLRFPSGLLMTQEGLLVVDSENHMIRTVSKNQASIFAGDLTPVNLLEVPGGGYKDGNRLNSQFNSPRSIVIDSKGNYFVADSKNNCIRKIAKDQVFTFAGTKKAGYVNGASDKAQFNRPIGITIDGEDNLYVADSLNHVIRKITPKGEVSTFAGSGPSANGYLEGQRLKAKFNEPQDVFYDMKGKILYIADTGNQVIRIVKDDKVTLFAGVSKGKDANTGYAMDGYKDGNAQTAQFSFPKGLFVYKDILLVTDTGNHAIRAVRGGKVFTLLGNGESGTTQSPYTAIQLNSPSDVIYADSVLYVADTKNNVVRSCQLKLDSLGKEQVSVLTSAGAFDIKESTPIIDGNLMLPAQSLFVGLGGSAQYDVSKKTVTVSYEGKKMQFSAKEGMKVISGKPYIPYQKVKAFIGTDMVQYSSAFNTIIVGR